VDSNGRTIWIADAHRGDGKRFVVRSEEKLTAFLELERVTANQEKAKNLAGKCTPPDSGPLGNAEFGKNLGCLSKNRQNCFDVIWGAVLIRPTFKNERDACIRTQERRFLLALEA
jgi:hypothetical protein